MTSPSEISATEKLLDLIRASSQAEKSDPVHGSDSSVPVPDIALRLDIPQRVDTQETPPPPSPLAIATEGGLVLTLEKNPTPELSDPFPPQDGVPTIDSPFGAETPPMGEELFTLVSPPPPEHAVTASTPAQPSVDAVARSDFRIPPPEASLTPDPSPADGAASFFTATSNSLPRRRSFLSFSRLHLPTKVSIGIDIRPGVIHLVKTHSSKNSSELLAWESVAYEFDHSAEHHNLLEDQEFKAALFRAVANFHSSHGHHEIWCSYPFARPIELHTISVPKVADKDLANAVFWSAKRELEFDETATVFDYVPLQDVNESNQTKTQALVMLAPLSEVDGVKTMFKNAGFPLTGISFPAAAIQNFLHHDRTIPTDQPVVYFTIRKSYSFIDLYYQGKIFFSREIKTGLDSFVESLMDQALAQNIVLDEDSAIGYLFRSPPPLSDETREAGTETITPNFDWDNLSVIGRLARQLVRTFEYCATNFKIPPVGAMITSGEFTVTDPILKSIENRVGVKCAVIDPLSSAILQRSTETSCPTISNLLVATGLSLSTKQSTANFLFTYADRAKETASNKVNSVIAIIAICLALGLGSVFAWKYNKASDKEKEVSLLHKKLEAAYQAEPRSQNNDYIAQTVQKISQFHRDNIEKVKRFKAVAIITEFNKTLDKTITLTDLTLDLPPADKETKNPKNPHPDGAMTINGFISAPPENQEFILMNFLKDLAQLQLIGDPTIVSKTSASLRNQDVLRFEVRLKTTLKLLTPPAT